MGLPAAWSIPVPLKHRIITAPFWLPWDRFGRIGLHKVVNWIWDFGIWNRDGIVKGSAVIHQCLYILTAEHGPNYWSVNGWSNPSSVQYSRSCLVVRCMGGVWAYTVTWSLFLPTFYVAVHYYSVLDVSNNSHYLSKNHGNIVVIGSKIWISYICPSFLITDSKLWNKLYLPANSYAHTCESLDLRLMAHTHCTEPGKGPWPGPGPTGFCIMLCTVHTAQGQTQGTIVFYRARSGPCPGPVQCVWAITLFKSIFHLVFKKPFTPYLSRSQNYIMYNYWTLFQLQRHQFC